MNEISKGLIGIGILIILVGIGIHFGSKLGLGRLPGDIVIEKQNFKLFFPLGTSILLSLFLSLVFWFFSKR